MPVEPIPTGYHTLTPYLVVPGAAKVIEFLKQAFDAEVVERMTLPDGTITHAEIQIGDSKLMLGEAWGGTAPKPATLYMYVKDTDAVYQKAIRAGGVSILEPADQFYGDRNAGVKDAGGNEWWIATHQEDVPAGELQKRSEAAMKKRSESMKKSGQV